MKDKLEAVALFSGGLDSILAIKLIQAQGIKIVGVNFKTPFFGLESSALNSQDLGIEIESIDITEELLKILRKPPHGFGKNMNPCIDCRILMYKVAGEYMRKRGASFLISGEVLGERAMSQNRNSLRIIERESGLEDRILRPLSALLMNETLPERNSWVERGKLLDISGRSRKRQMELADRMNIVKYPSPAGGCKLTEPEFAKRLRDLFQQEDFSLPEIELLKLGRHFRLGKNIKLIVGRNRQENERLPSFFQKEDLLFRPKNLKGPVALLKRVPLVQEDNLNLLIRAGQIIARYCDQVEGEKEEIYIYYFLQNKQFYKTIEVQPIQEEELIELRI